MKTSTSKPKKGSRKKAIKKTKKNIVPLITQTEYAKRRGVSRQNISKQVKAGLITLIDKKIDPEKADKELHENMIPAMDIRGSGSVSTTLLKARTKKEAYAALLAELCYKKETGILVREKEIRHANETIYRRFRDCLLNIPDRIASQLAAESLENKIHKLLTNEIKIAIQESI